MIASLTIPIPGEATLDDLDSINEKLIELGSTDWPTIKRTIVVEWEGDNLWDLRGAVEEALYALKSWDDAWFSHDLIENVVLS